MRQPGTSRPRLLQLLRESPIAPDDDWLRNLHLYQPATILAKILYLNDLYRRIVTLPGEIFECGVWWGANLAVLANLRTVHEPYNRERRLVGFDTFTGYPTPGQQDGASVYMQPGEYGVTPDYRAHLEAVLAAHEAETPTAHVRKFEVVAGDAAETVPAYLDRHPACFIALAYLDLQLYVGTRAVLSAIKPRLLPGSVIAMDELTSRDYPGEGLAFREVFADVAYTIERSPVLPDRSIVTYRGRLGSAAG